MSYRIFTIESHVKSVTYCESTEQQVQYCANFITEENILGVICMISTGEVISGACCYKTPAREQSNTMRSKMHIQLYH
jgi:hypothetical protein